MTKRTTLKLVEKILVVKEEEKKIINFIKNLDKERDKKVLDIGCGYGQKFKKIKELGIYVTGIDINEIIVNENKKNGINCLTVHEFEASNEMYDILLMSHIIEHFQPGDLLSFMDSYLDRLKDDGHLIISTPLNSPYFYDDFDHVRPYQPTGISMVFCDHKSQVQYHSRNRLEMIDIWFRKEPFKLKFFAVLYPKKHSKILLILKVLIILINIISTFIFYMSFRLFGRVDGWIGLYRKVGA
jgi:SAM-dependent methyltransferase